MRACVYVREREREKKKRGQQRLVTLVEVDDLASGVCFHVCPCHL